MRTWVIFALLSVIVAAAQKGEAAGVHDPAILHVIDKGIKKVQSLVPGNDKEETAAENSLSVFPGIRGPLGHFGALFPGHHFPHGRKPAKPAPEAPVVDEDNEDINVVDNDDVNEEDNEEDVVPKDVPADEKADDQEVADDEETDNEVADDEEADDEVADDEEADDEEAADKVADKDKDAEDDDDSDSDSDSDKPDSDESDKE